jgi:adenylate kinase family enzyme
VQRVAIMGPGGSGKSMLAEALASRTGLPVVYLDPIFWRPGWVPAPEEEARAALAEAVAGERWIIDGNFLEDGEPGARFERADTVVFLDMPTAVCLGQALWRLARDRRRDRPDLPVGAREGLDLPFLRWILTYRRAERPRVLALLAGLDRRIAVYRLTSRREVRGFVESRPPGCHTTGASLV